MSPYYADESVALWLGDALEVLRTLSAGSVDCCVTSPPYFGLRDYGVPGQYGAEASPAEYVETMRVVFAEVRRVLADDGTLWLNLGDSYASGGGTAGVGRNAQVRATRRQSEARTRPAGDRPTKNLLGIPWRIAFALQADGWVLRNAIVWAKPNAMPDSVTDRLSNRHEILFLLAKEPRYWFDLDAVREAYAPDTAARYRLGYSAASTSAGKQRPTVNSDYSGTFETNPKGRNPGDVWTIPTQPFPEAHFAVMAPELARRCIVAGCKPGGTVLDPFCGSGTTGVVAQQHGRRFVGIDLNREYLELALRTRLAQTAIVDEVAS